MRLVYVFSLCTALIVPAALLNRFPGIPLTPASALQKHREEVSEDFDLNPGAQVTIRGINGSVRIETWDRPKAEVRIVKSTSSDRENLKLVEVILEHTARSLEIRTRKVHGDSPHVRVEVEARLPRQLELNIGGVNGHTEIGEIAGPITASGLNGRLHIERASDRLDLSGINGSIRATMTGLGPGGVSVTGVNGPIVIALPESTNATIDVTGHNGSLNTDFPLAVIGKIRRNEVHAQLGAGGSPIGMHGINGSITLSRTAN